MMQMKWFRLLIVSFVLTIGLAACNSGDGFTYVEIETEFGTMKAKLYNATPLHRDNFIKLVQEGFYDSLLFHRVINGFMIQGGDPDSKNARQDMALGMGGPGYTIPAEFVDTLLHKKGALSAARMADQVNPNRESSGSQFYIVQGKPVPTVQLDAIANQMGITYTDKQKEIYSTMGGAPFLDRQYTVFGEVVEGLDIIDKIASQPTSAYSKDRPNKDIRMKIRIVK
ncbi:MAG: peptidylprolyl isomerase [Saprospiraceae bacterium]|nr:peptidylprolyl isomerase [Saprospiraceae bacterium]